MCVAIVTHLKDVLGLVHG